MRLLGTLVAAAALTLGGVVAAPVTAPAAAAACSGTSGVTVVIGSSVRCAPGNPASGLAALSAVATVKQVQRQPGFVCRIDGAPASDPCINTPPATAYWSYWHAQPGGTWTYSTKGAGSYDPAPGSVEGWAFGDGKPPSSRAPAAPAAPAPSPSPTKATPAPTTTTRPPATGGSGGSSGSGGSGGSSGSGGSAGSAKPSTGGDVGRTSVPAAPGGTGSAAATTTAPTSAAPTPAAPGGTGSGQDGTGENGSGAAGEDASGPDGTSGTAERRTEASAVRSTDDGPSLSPAVGGALVLGLAGAAGTVAWRRRANG